MCAARNQGRLGTISAGEAQGAFSVGDACEAFYVEDGKYYKAEIVRALGGGMYRINYVEYSFERDLKASEIKLPPGAVKKAPMTNGAPPRATPQVNGFSSGAQSMRVETRRPTASSSQTVRMAPTSKPPTPSGAMTQRQAPKTTPAPPRPHTNLPAVPPSGISAVALFEFRAAKATEIDLNPGDKITNIQQTGQWWTGTVNGRTGKFPYNYVELQQTAPAPSSSSSGGGAGGSAAIPVPPRPTLRNNNASAAPPRPAFSGSASMVVKTARTPPAPPTARPAVTPRSAPTTPTIPTKSPAPRAEIPPPPTSPRKPAPAPVVTEAPVIAAPVTRPPLPTAAKPPTPTPSPRPPPTTPSAPPRGASIAAPTTAPSISPRPAPSVPAKSTPPVPTKSTPPAPIPKEPLNPTPAAPVAVPPRPSAPSHTSPANDARSKRISTKKLPPSPAKPAVPAAPVMGGGGKVPPPPPPAPVGGGIPPPPPANGFTPPALTPSPPAPVKRAAPAAPAGATFKAREAISAKWREDGQWYAAVVERVYEEGGVQYFDITFTEYGNTETYMTAAELKKLPGAKQEDDEPKAPPGSFAAALAAKANRLNQTGLKQEGEDVVEIAVTKKSGDIASSLEETKVTKRALAMSVYMLQDKMQGVDADEWEDDEDDVFDF